MITIICPCCRAENTSGPACRRCTADLSLLFQLAEHREYLLANAREFLRIRDSQQALTLLDEAEQLRPDDDIRQLRATAHLLNRNYAAAFQCRG